MVRTQHPYGGQCAITGSDAGPALEAAHPRPYRGVDSNVISDGLPLRGDIHTLFDLGLLAIDPVTRQIVVSKLLAQPSTRYMQFKMGIRARWQPTPPHQPRSPR